MARELIEIQRGTAQCFGPVKGPMIAREIEHQVMLLDRARLKISHKMLGIATMYRASR